MAALREEVGLYLRQGGFKRSAQSNGVGVYQSSRRPEVVALEAGVGRENAERATRYALENYSPEFIISAGFAGAVAPGLDTGRLFLCDTLSAIDGPPALWNGGSSYPVRSVDAGLAQELARKLRKSGGSLASCGCMTVSTFVSGSGLKGWIGKNFPVQVVDMESYWVCGLASEHGVPAAAVRSVLDAADEDIPEFVSSEAQSVRTRRWARALRHLAAKPHHTRRLLKLRSQSKAASKSLSTFLKALHDDR